MDDAGTKEKFRLGLRPVEQPGQCRKIGYWSNNDEENKYIITV